MSDRPTFEIGIVMAGAVSAGAYSAGVMDFIIEALDAYEKAKSEPGWDGPTHDVRIPVLAGASAGGMTAAISALHAFNALEHVWPDRPEPEGARNRLYSSWVKDISIERLLETTDLDNGRDAQGVKSILCCDVLDEIVERAFSLAGPVRAPNWVGRGADHSLRVFFTLTNLRGVPYSFKLFGADKPERYGMLNHGDYLDFTVGRAPAPIEGSHPLDIDHTGAEAWRLFKTAALATGAFPVGLAPRPITRTAIDYRYGDRVGYEDPKNGFRTIQPDDSIFAQNPYSFVSVDGGTIDNEPLELARRYLAGGDGAHNNRNGQEATRAMVLVAPFPNLQKTPTNDGKEKVIDVVPKLFSTLIEQARFKPDELAMAESDEIFSRFIISPSRPANGNPEAAKYPIASGVLGAFGGFLHESFRRHDYLLGRRNAQSFLRWSFALPDTNPLFRDFQQGREKWYVSEAPDVPATGAPAKFATHVAGGETRPGLPIIPLAPHLLEEIVIGRQDLPRPQDVALADLSRRVRTRAGKVIGALVDVDLREMTSGVLGMLERAGAYHFGVQVATKKANEAIAEAVSDVRAAFDLPK